MLRPKILVIGLDAATMDLIGPWAREGQLPALAGLMNRGYAARLLSTPNMHSASAWTSILTGLSPGRHGLFVFSDRDFNTGRQDFFTGGDRKGDIIGAHLANQGFTSGFLNVPMTYPAEGTAGSFMVSGLDAPELNAQSFHPASLRVEFFERFPDYRFSPTSLGGLMRSGKVEEATREWLKLIDIQTAAGEYLIATRPVDFFMIVYTASDWAGHNLWDRPSEMLSIYRKLDEAISRLLRHAGNKTQVYVISDHGMGRHSGASYHLAQWLETRGYMVRKPAGSAPQSLLKRGKGVARAVLPAGVKERIKSTLGGERLKRIQAAEKDSFYSSIDWSRTVAYTEPGRHVININLAGRNRDGIVAKADYAATCRRIVNDLGDWVDAGGNRFVERVAGRDEEYRGPFVERASDLYVYWNAAADAGPPPDEVRARGFWWSGDHRREGVLIAGGAGIDNSVARSNPVVHDFVPTVMYAAGLRVPEDLDGRVLEEAFTEDFKSRTPIHLESGESSSSHASPQLTDEEEQKIEDKLRSLGYL